MAAKQLFLNQAADGESAETFVHRSLSGQEPLNIYVKGDLGGGTLLVKAKAPDDTFIPIAGEGITAEGLNVLIAGPFEGKVELTGSTGADLTVWVETNRDAFARVR